MSPRVRGGLWLGLRRAVRPAGPARGIAARTVAAAAAVAAVAVLAWGLTAGAAAREHRAQWATPTPAATSAAAFLALVNTTPYRDDVWTLVLLAPLRPNAPPPPGLTAFPDPGRSALSPAAAQALRSDPTVAGRAPGVPAGEIAEAGLQSPDQFLVYAGVTPEALAAGQHASGWGAAWTADDRPAVPTDGLLVVVACLIGLPLLLLVAVVATLGSAYSRRRAQALHLLGVPASQVARAAGVEAAVHCLLGVVLGCALVAAALPLIATSGIAGLRWFPSDTTLAPIRTTLLALATTIVVARVVARRCRTQLAGPTVPAAEPGDPLRGGRQRHLAGLARLTLGAAGAGVLLAYVAVRRLRPEQPLSSGLFAVVAVLAMAAVVAGAVLWSRDLLAAAGRAVAGRARSAGTVVAGRRVESDAAGFVVGMLAVVVVLTAAALASAVTEDIARQSPPTSGGHLVGVSLPPGEQARAVVDIPALSTLVVLARPGDDATPVAVAGTCRVLAAIVRRSGTGSDCATPQEAGFGGARLVSGADDAPGTVPVAVYAQTGPSRADAQRYVSAVLAAEPTAAVSYADVSSAAPMAPALLRLVRFCTLLGLLVAVTCLGLSVLDRAVARRREMAVLALVGAHRAELAEIEVRQTVLAAAACGALALPAAALCRAAYAAMAGTPGPPFPGAAAWPSSWPVPWRARS